MFARCLDLTAKEIVAGRNVKMAHFHLGSMAILVIGENLYASLSVA